MNQHLSVGERAELLALGGPCDEIFNVERIRAALDDPRGYGLRLEFLRIPMSPEEQVAFPVFALELIASGAWHGSGVLGPEALLPQPFLDLDLLTEYGPPWSMREDVPAHE